MPDVWLKYIKLAEKIARGSFAQARATRSRAVTPPDDTIDLLLTPWSGVRPGAILKRLLKSIGGDFAKGPAPYLGAQTTLPRVAVSDTRVVVRANFNTLVCHIVPLSSWWQESFVDDKNYPEAFKRIVKDQNKPRGTDAEFARYFALVGFIDCLVRARSQNTIKRLAALADWLGSPDTDAEDATDVGDAIDVEDAGDVEDAREALDAASNLRTLTVVYWRARKLLWHAVEPASATTTEPSTPPAPTAGGATTDEDVELGIFLISLNRPATQSLYESRATTKADAAHRVFEIDTSNISFAVIDGGIDAGHPAFLDRAKRETADLGERLPDHDFCLKYSRVKATYDFTRLRALLAFAISIPSEVAPIERDKAILATLEEEAKQDDKKKLIAELYYEHWLAFHHLAVRGKNARDLDWEIVRPLIQIDHVLGKYKEPKTDHGTHVAGILAAYLPKRKAGRGNDRELSGMCRNLKLYDLRVFDDQGRSDEYTILSALEFLGWMNKDRANPVVHGANLSLALAHDVDSFACGQTPICDVCNYLVGAGTVIVAAAGNTGFENGAGPQKQSIGTGYRPISITDPGNADSVITVGSTHRRDPHLYGVSYFSARGPTGDGRRKPDILAPGEKITSTIPGDALLQRMDGTSMAAPHVSGAAAMLMARYPELIGRPLRIKQILMDTATDLKREPSFQGAGLVDVLRALQSV